MLIVMVIVRHDFTYCYLVQLSLVDAEETYLSFFTNNNGAPRSNKIFIE